TGDDAVKTCHYEGNALGAPAGQSIGVAQPMHQRIRPSRYLQPLAEVQPTLEDRDRRRELTLYEVDVTESVGGDHDAQLLLGRLGDSKPFFCVVARRRELSLLGQHARQEIARADRRKGAKAEVLARHRPLESLDGPGEVLNGAGTVTRDGVDVAENEV